MNEKLSEINDKFKEVSERFVLKFLFNENEKLFDARNDFLEMERDEKRTTNKTIFTDEEIIFVFAMCVAAGNIDGEFVSVEKEIVKMLLYKCPKYEKQLKKIYKNPPTFKELYEYYEAIEDKDNDVYLEVLTEIIIADKKKRVSEKLFEWKIKQLFNGIYQERLCWLPQVGESSNKYLEQFVSVLSEKDVEKKYRHNTKYEDQFFLCHPLDKRVLIPFEDYFNSQFIYDRDTEILEALRIAGAKEVYIKLASLSETETSFNQKIKAKVVENPVNISAKVGMDFFNKIKNGKILYVKFNGSREPKETRDRFIEESSFIKNDPKVSWLMKTQYEKNKVSSFYHESEYSNLMNMNTTMSLNANVLEIGDFENKISASIEMLSDKKMLFIANFE